MKCKEENQGRSVIVYNTKPVKRAPDWHSSSYRCRKERCLSATNIFSIPAESRDNVSRHYVTVFAAFHFLTVSFFLLAAKTCTFSSCLHVLMMVAVFAETSSICL